MAKPGSDQARELTELAALSRMAVEIPTKLPPSLAAKFQAQAEAQLGMRCSGCGGRITVGFEFTRVVVAAAEEGKPVVDVQRVSACNGAAGCDFALRVRESGATAMQAVEYVWLDEDPAPTKAEGRPADGGAGPDLDRRADPE